MALTSLLVCADAKSVQVLTRILLDMGIEVEHCGDPSLALACVSTQHFDAILVDCQDEDAATSFISQVREDSTGRDTVIIAMLDGGNNVREVFAKGANFALYKPISVERINNSIAAAQTPTRGERRLAQRVTVDANASIAYAGIENEVTRVVDLSEDGMAIYSPKALPRDCKVYFQFSLPEESSTIRLSCEVIWQNDSGNVGLRFVDVPKGSRRVLDYWIRNRVDKQLQIVASPAASAQPSNDLRQQLAAHLGLVAAPPPERRQQPRYQCSLGAEVSRAGSTIQQRCAVSDVSVGGCYVQTSEPLPVGTAIEIVLRTQDLKLRLRGKVQSVHRGLGMGVQFNVMRLEEQQQLERLMSEVQTSQVPS
jgi:CheY-like chemotaxis protein